MSGPVRILAAGDSFVRASEFESELSARLPVGLSLEFRELLLPWPQVPFGAVDEVTEASGTVADLIDALDGVEIAVTQVAAFTREVFERSPSLRFVGVSRGGPVNVNLDAATDAGVLVSFAPGRNAQAAAEFAVGMMLAAMRRIAGAGNELREGTWRGDYYTYENSGLELAGETVGLIGLGAIGRIVARILVAFGAHVVAFDPYTDAAAAARDGVELVDLDSLLASSMIVSIHARLTDETRHILNEDRLNSMREGAVLVNMARGGLLDYAPLPGLLESGRLGAVALDVYDIEPPPANWPLFRAPNVVLTPHLAGATRQTARRAASIIAGEVAHYLAGEPLEHLANPAVLAVLDAAGRVR
jgi:D-3-phosphoglycerate dehydrogenase